LNKKELLALAGQAFQIENHSKPLPDLREQLLD